MSLEQKIAQLFIFGIGGISLEEQEYSWLQQYQIGGIIMMGDNISTKLTSFIEDIQYTNKDIPLFIAIDQEGGIVTRIDESLPGQLEILKENVCNVYNDRDIMLYDIGINLNFGIIADISDNPKSFIYARTFHGDVEAKISKAVLCSRSVLNTLKYFPGHGGTATDTHQGVSLLGVKQSLWREKHLPPFITGIEAGVDVIMVGHLIAPFLDKNMPASLSASNIGYLRGLGFTGLIITDDMDMLANNYYWQDALEKALIAGNDLIMYVESTDKRTKIIEYTINLLNSGTIDENDLNARVTRILEAKKSIINQGQYIPKELYYGE